MHAYAKKDIAMKTAIGILLAAAIGTAEAADMTTDAWSETVFPTPQKAAYHGERLPIRHDEALLLIDPKLGNGALISRELKERISSLGGSVSEDESAKKSSEFALVISVGETELYKRHRNSSLLMPPSQPEGYQIKFVKDGKSSICFLAGRDEPGCYWAAKSLGQLISGKGGEARLRKAEIYDYPAFKKRIAALSMVVNKDFGWGKDSFAAYSKRMADYKFNSVMPCGFHFLRKYLDLPETLSFEDAKFSYWRNTYEDGKLSDLKTLNAFFKERGMEFTVIISPCLGKSYKDPELCAKMRISDKEQVELLLDFLRRLARNGVSDFSIWLDDVSLPLPTADKKLFGDAGRAHTYLVNTIYGTMKKEFPDFKMSFCSALYMTSAHDEVKGNPHMDVDVDKYWGSLREGISKDIAFTWNGKYVCSPKISSADAVHMGSILDKDLILLDFGWSGHFLESYHFDSIPIARRLSPDIHKYLLGYAFPIGTYPQNEVILAQLADYLWNPDGFDAERSRNIAASRLFGPETTPLLIEWNEQIGYFDKYALTLTPGALNKLDELDAKLKNLHALFERIQKVCENDELTKSLKYYLNILDAYPKKLKNAKFPNIEQEVKKLEEEAQKEIGLSPEDIFLPSTKFFGGSAGVSGYKCKPRHASWVYAPKTAAAMSVEFDMDDDMLAKAAAPKLLLCAQDDEIDAQCKIEISLNGAKFFEGRNEFPRFGWGVKEFPIPTQYLKKGKNVLEIKNAEEGDAVHGAPWFMVSYCAIRLK